MEEEINKTLDWKRRFLETANDNNGYFRDLLNEMNQLGIRVPEMLEAINYQREWWIWKNKIVSIRRKLRKKRENIFEANDELSLEELDEIIREGEEDIRKIEPNDEDLEEIQEKVQRIKIVRERLGSTEVHWTLTDLKNLERELKSINIKFEEICLLKERIDLNLKIKEILDEQVYGEELTNRLHDFLDVMNHVDEDLIEEINRRKQGGGASKTSKTPSQPKG